MRTKKKGSKIGLQCKKEVKNVLNLPRSLVANVLSQYATVTVGLDESIVVRQTERSLRAVVKIFNVRARDLVSGMVEPMVSYWIC